MTSEDPEKEPSSDLQWRDYVAITIAALETVLLPLVILVVIMVAAFLVIR